MVRFEADEVRGTSCPPALLNPRRHAPYVGESRGRRHLPPSSLGRHRALLEAVVPLQISGGARRTILALCPPEVQVRGFMTTARTIFSEELGWIQKRKCVVRCLWTPELLLLELCLKLRGLPQIMVKAARAPLDYVCWLFWIGGFGLLGDTTAFTLIRSMGNAPWALTTRG